MTLTDVLPWLNLLVLPVLWAVLRFVLSVEKRLIRLEARLADLTDDAKGHAETMPNLARQLLKLDMRLTVLTRSVRHLVRHAGLAPADSGLTEPGQL